MSDSHISLQFLLMLLPACKLQLCVCVCVCVCVWTPGAPNDSVYPWKEWEYLSVVYVEFSIREELDLLIPKAF